MKVVILAGGLGTRLQEETTVRPKPMVEIGGRPILWHIMKIYAAHRFSEFIVALGYKGELIKDYFLNYRLYASNLTIQLHTSQTEARSDTCEEWTVHLLDTGSETQTGGRIKRTAPLIGKETFMLTYGDGVANVNINRLIDFHRSHKRLATILAVRPPARFGGLRFEGDKVVAFEEKPQVGEGWINGGFFVLEPRVMDYIGGDEAIFERVPLERLARDGELVAYRHEGFWQCMDTLRDVRLLEELWESGKAPWKVWD